MVTVSTRLGLELNTEAARKLREMALEEGAFLKSDSPIYRLSSGKLSNHYFDGKLITLSTKCAPHVAKMVLDEVSGIQVDAIGGLVIGAALIVAAVAAIAEAEDKAVATFIVREEAKEHGTKQKIEGHLKKGWKVAIVDDVITTGTSVSKAIRAVEAEDCEVVKVIALVDRHEGGSDKLRAEGYKFQAFLDLKSSGDVGIEHPLLATA